MRADNAATDASQHSAAAALADIQPVSENAASAVTGAVDTGKQSAAGEAPVTVADEDIAPCATLGQLLRRMLQLLGRPHEVKLCHASGRQPYVTLVPPDHDHSPVAEKFAQPCDLPTHCENLCI